MNFQVILTGISFIIFSRHDPHIYALENLCLRISDDIEEKSLGDIELVPLENLPEASVTSMATEEQKPWEEATPFKYKIHINKAILYNFITYI